MILMIIHFSVSYEDTLILVCFNSYNIMFNVGLVWKEHMGNKLHVIHVQQRMLCSAF